MNWRVIFITIGLIAFGFGLRDPDLNHLSWCLNEIAIGAIFVGVGLKWDTDKKEKP